MNPLHVLVAFFAANTYGIAALRGPYGIPVTETKAGAAPLTVVVEAAGESSPAALPSLPSAQKVTAQVHTRVGHEGMAAANELLQAKEQTKLQERRFLGGSTKFLASSSSSLWQMIREKQETLPLVIVVVILTIFLLVLLWGFNSRDKELAPGQDLLKINQAKSTGMPPAKGPISAVATPPEPVSEDLRAHPDKRRASLFSNVGGIFGSGTGPEPVHAAEHRFHFVPEMVVQEKEGARLYVDGEILKSEQNGYIEVWRAEADRDYRQVMRLSASEGDNGPHGHQNGMVMEVMNLSKIPLAFISTQFATDRPAHVAKHSNIKNRHIVIFDTFMGDSYFHKPFCTAERESRGVTLRRCSDSSILCIVSSGGYNTDFGNIVDPDGRLIATSSNRGHGLFGLGMVHGAWTQGRRVVQVAQGNDVAMVICALVCAAKLS